MGKKGLRMERGKVRERGGGKGERRGKIQQGPEAGRNNLKGNQLKDNESCNLSLSLSLSLLTLSRQLSWSPHSIV